MLVIPIEKIEVFDSHRTKKYGTELNLTVDGVTIYGLVVQGTGNPYSGVKTVGAFKSEDKETLVAWIDPVSTLLFYADESREREQFVVTGIFLLFLSLFIFAGHAGWFASDRANLMAMAIFAITFGTLSYRNRLRWKRMDQKLRAALKNLP